MDSQRMDSKSRAQMSTAVELGTDRLVAVPNIADAERRRRIQLQTWLWSGAVLTFFTLVIGGITRLTQSGLSIVDWQPIMGVIPPLSEAAWQETFDRYRQFPEYQQLRQGMSLSEFRFIFFWEYLHRMIARLIGVVFLVPFIVFWARGYFDRKLLRRALILFGLGGLQGFMGWFMVSSGLVDQPHVSHYRLAIHLTIAFSIFAGCVWFAIDLNDPARRPAISQSARRLMTRGLYAVGALLAVQIFWGALVAGLKAGYYFNTFPLMDGGWVPPYVLGMDPPLLNFVENPITVQWVHRILGTVLGLAAIALFARVWRSVRDGFSRTMNAALLLLILGQYLLGVLTLIFHVPVSLGVAHQAVAMVIFGVWLVWLHHVRAAPVPGAPQSEAPHHRQRAART
jgi:heme a synthase